MQPPAESPDPTVIPIQQARTEWDPANPFDASLVFEVDGSGAALDLNLPVMTALLGDLEDLNRKRAIQAGWTADDDPEEDDDEKRSLASRFLASHTAVQTGLNRLPLSWQAMLAVAVIVSPGVRTATILSHKAFPLAGRQVLPMALEVTELTRVLSPVSGLRTVTE